VIKEKNMENLFQKDLGAIMLSFAIVLGWLALGAVVLRSTALVLKYILEKIFKDKS
tara:strand:- start:6794 stop:6961 length:168 start_codon:yes stop_codon:yes gene_type:complete